MHAVSKLVLMQCGRDSKAACGNTQLCAGLETGIEGTIHVSIQCATTDNTLQFPDEGTHTVASMDNQPPYTKPLDLRTQPPTPSQHSRHTHDKSPHPA